MIRGKVPNAFKTSKSTFLSNQEIASIITIIGGGYGKNFDLSKVKFDKIIFLADADPDKFVLCPAWEKFHENNPLLIAGKSL